MRFGFGLVLALLAAAMAPAARAEFPGSARVYAGGGLGAAHRASLANDGFFGILAADVAWRERPGRSFVLSYEWSGGPAGHSYELYGLYPPERLRSVDQQAILLGSEWSWADSGNEPFLQAGLGVGRLATKLRHSEPVSFGPALSGTVGFRFSPNPGPLGFVMGLHTGHVFTEHARSHELTLFFGFNFHPR